VCESCGGRRQYFERISVGRGSVVARCGGCRYEARKRHQPERSVPLTACHSYTETTLLAGEIRQVNTYLLCDTCINAELARAKEADIIDGREPRPTSPAS